MTAPNSLLAQPSGRVLGSLAAEVGACVRPVLQQLTDTMTGEVRVVAIPCGATLASTCPSCAEKARKLRMQQCREGWHLSDDPIPPEHESNGLDSHNEEEDQDDSAGLDDSQNEDEYQDHETEPARRHRSTRRRQDVPDLPSQRVQQRSVGRTYSSAEGKTYRPSTFVTVTLDSYGPVHEDDGTPLDPARYDYHRAALDAMHMPKLWDRFVQNLRRAAGFRVQYFACVEPQRRLAPHVHAAMRGSMPNKLIKQVIDATYHQLWWPQLHTPVYTDRLPIWSPDEDGTARYVDPDTRTPLPTWAEALDAIDQDPEAAPAHVLRFGTQKKVVGVIAGRKADNLIRYLTKYLTKAIDQGVAPDAERSDRQTAHARRLHEHVRYLPCSPACANWLRFGITPANASAGMVPGYCPKRAHRADRLGCGGRRVLVSRYWTGKTLTDHATDRREHVRATLESMGLPMPDGHSATEQRPDGQPRWDWQAVRPRDLDRSTYTAALRQLIDRRLAWREQYEHARDRHGPPDSASNSATAAEDVEGSDHDDGPIRAT